MLDGRQQTPEQRREFLQAIRLMLRRRDVSLGQALRVLRSAYLRMDRTRFAEMTGVSRRELAKLETDVANPTVNTLDRVFRPFGMRVGIVSSRAEAGESVDDDRYAEWLVAVRGADERNRRR